MNSYALNIFDLNYVYLKGNHSNIFLISTNKVELRLTDEYYQIPLIVYNAEYIPQ